MTPEASGIEAEYCREGRRVVRHLSRNEAPRGGRSKGLASATSVEARARASHPSSTLSMQPRDVDTPARGPEKGHSP